jgi:hypothetical protein
MKTAPTTPEQLRTTLVSIFPSFEAEIDEDTSYGHEITFHTLMFDFTPFFGKNIKAFSEKQMRGLAELVHLAIEVPGPLENAMSTCFLEHTKAIRVNRELNAALAAVRRG